METNNLNEQDQNNEQNLSAEELEQKRKEAEHKKKHSNAALLDSIIKSPTEQVRTHKSHDTLSNTGTNTSYNEKTPSSDRSSTNLDTLGQP